MCMPCSANKCRIRESNLQAACLVIIFLNGYYYRNQKERPSETYISDGLLHHIDSIISNRFSF